MENLKRVGKKATKKSNKKHYPKVLPGCFCGENSSGGIVGELFFSSLCQSESLCSVANSCFPKYRVMRCQRRNVDNASLQQQCVYQLNRTVEGDCC